ncbi:putative dehydrogenase [Hyella patelloides LEGE 07179]|uniref:Putative dehydrogenase n=1 Tax=Hyella patelloides LEGE 07179 TaxID=945734 RepID=A0A563VVT8_9CYAN|nr:Gfo/Idh/MocA family oxidoreductase [Hyella patelloides]VEP15373.1 putative dehydrogenase [Hyella patelloides LEGE 07179]
MKTLKIGIVGTGYAAKKRAEAISEDTRAILVSVTGNSPERIQEFASSYSVSAVDSWQRLVGQAELDLIIVCTVNRDHGAIARAALQSDKHVIVEYPLALNYTEALEIIALAKEKQKLLHIEHMEIIGGLHQAIREYLPQIGNIFYARYNTIAPQRDVPRNWKYHKEMFGFPLNAALSRVHRLTDLFGEVEKVFCQNRYWNLEGTDYFTACLCNAQLNFTNGIVAEITYGKGDIFWWGHRTFEIHGDRGTLLFEGEKGTFIKGKERTPIPVTSRRGLFAKDTTMVLNHLFDNKGLYVQPSASLYATKVANAACQSAKIGQPVRVD